MVRNHWVAMGRALFRWRSYVPLMLTPFFMMAALEVGRSLGPARWHRTPEIVGLTISLFGLVLRIIVVGTAPRGTSGRNTRRQKATVLNTRGIYSIMRHPLYFANGLVALGLASYTGHPWLPLVVATAAVLYYERIVAAEEAFLEERFGDDFRRWASRVPAMWPRIREFVPAETRFSWRRVCRAEFHAAATIGATTVVIELLKHYAERGHFVLERMSFSLATVSGALFVSGWVWKKVPGRRHLLTGAMVALSVSAVA
jgi:protein-S-isoprenylcysteine O-methyltransferase Ste14